MFLIIGPGGGTVIAVAMLNESGGGGDQLLDKLAKVLSKSNERKIEQKKHLLCYSAVLGWKIQNT